MVAHINKRKKEKVRGDDIVRMSTKLTNPLCKKCNLRSARNGSKYCQQCSDEYHKESVAASL